MSDHDFLFYAGLLSTRPPAPPAKTLPRGVTAHTQSPMSAASPVAGGIKLSLARSRSPVASSRLHDTSCSTLGGAGLSPSGSGEDVEDVGGEGDVVRR